jgi:hypothetical protein
MKTILLTLLPPRVDNTVRGSKLPVYVFMLTAILSTVRSCIHLFAPDGGAGSIAGMNLAVAGAGGIVFAFALWGSSQLLFAIVQLLVAFRYRALVPLFWLLMIVEVLLRQLVWRMKPVAFAHTPPGAYANRIYLPLAVLMLIVSLWPRKAAGSPDSLG